jgi:ketosteroid isomerase-like protein
VENVMPPGFASPYHVHHLEDEAFYVLEGEMAFVCDGKWTAAGPGTYVFGPRDLPHGFKVLGDAPARMLLLCTPSGFEQFVVEMSEPAPAPPDMAKLMAVAAKYSVDILGPLPEQSDVPARPASVRSSASLKDAADRIRAEHVAAVNAGDIDAALSIFASDVAVMPPGRPVLQGAALRAWYTEVFANFSLRGFDIRPDAVDEFGNAVIEHGNWNATLQPKNGSPSQPVGGTYVTAYARVADGSVRVIRDIFNGMPA